MANKNTKKDYQLMNEFAVSTAVDSRIMDEGAKQLDNASANASRLDNYLNDEILLKKELLSLIRKSRTEGMTEDIKRQILDVQLKLKSLSAPEKIETHAVETQKIGMSYDEMVISNEEFAKKYDIDLKNPYLESLSNIDKTLLQTELSSKFDLLKLDKYDYAFATAVGLLCGAVDALLIGTASNKKEDMGLLAQKNDDFFDKLVMAYAKKQNWKGPKTITRGGETITSDPLRSAIGYLEREFPVGYDQRTPADIKSDEKINLNPKNHHLLSLSHSPLGLIFAIFDLMNDKSTFVNPTTGKIVQIDSSWSKGAQSSNLNQVDSVVEATQRWFGHLVSDVAGSSSGKGGRGAGLPTGVESILQSLNFGKIPIKSKAGNEYDTINQVVQEMYTNGFDFRFSVATSIPVIIYEVLIRLYWLFKQHFYYGKPIKESIPFGKKRELQRMLLIAALSFSTVDATHAIVKGNVNRDPITTLNSLNYIGLANLGYKLFVNFKLEHEHNEKIKQVMQTEIKQKHEQLMNANYLLE